MQKIIFIVCLVLWGISSVYSYELDLKILPGEVTRDRIPVKFLLFNDSKKALVFSDTETVPGFIRSNVHLTIERNGSIVAQIIPKASEKSNQVNSLLLGKNQYWGGQFNLAEFLNVELNENKEYEPDIRTGGETMISRVVSFTVRPPLKPRNISGKKAISLAKSAVAGKVPFPENVKSKTEFGEEVVTVTIPSGRDWNGERCSMHRGIIGGLLL